MTAVPERRLLIPDAHLGRSNIQYLFRATYSTTLGETPEASIPGTREALAELEEGQYWSKFWREQPELGFKIHCLVSVQKKLSPHFDSYVDLLVKEKFGDAERGSAEEYKERSKVGLLDRIDKELQPLLASFADSLESMGAYAK